MIYVVQNCNTLFEIQCAAKQLGSTFNMESSLINKWIRNYSEDSKLFVFPFVPFVLFTRSSAC